MRSTPLPWPALPLLLAAIGCSLGPSAAPEETVQETPATHTVRGTVVQVASSTKLVVDHEAIEGFMEAMVMPFHLEEAALSAGLRAGDRIEARLVLKPEGAVLDRVEVVGHAKPASAPQREAAPKVMTTEVFPTTSIPVTGGETWTVGEGAGVPTLLTFLYTRCPMPEFCPATVLKLQALQARVEAGVRILAVTIDPDHDTLDHLQAYGEGLGADPARWRFGRLEGEALRTLADRAGLEVYPGPEQTIEHGTRYLVIDAEGRVLQKYFDNGLDMDRVAKQLTTGRPKHDEDLGPVAPWVGRR